VDELQRKAPPAATVAAVPTPAAYIAAVEQGRPRNKTWPPKKHDSRKRRRSSDGDKSGQSAQKKPKPWETMGICLFHHTYGNKAKNCEAPCL